MGYKAYDGLELFGIEELEKQFEKTSKKFSSKSTALLKAQGDIWKKEVKRLTPVIKSKREDRVPGKLKKSWRLLSPKVYHTSSGNVEVARIQSTEPYAHLVEDGHEIITTRRTRDSSGRYKAENKKTGRVSKYNSVQRSAKGIKSGGRVKGKEMLEKSRQKVARSFFREAEKMLNELTDDYN